MAATTVVNAAYDTSGNGGRKLVRLSNGWLVAVVIDPTTRSSPSTSDFIRFYKSQDNGQTWTSLCYANMGSGKSGVPTTGLSIVAKGNIIYCLWSHGVSGSQSFNRVLFFKIDATTVSGDITSSQVALETTATNTGACSLTISEDGTVLNGAWSSVVSPYPNSLNIRYAKGTIDGSGNVTWGSVTQVTTSNTSGTNWKNPCIVVRSNGYPSILAEAISGGSSNFIYSNNFNGSTWDLVVAYTGTSYAQSSPCAVVDGNGVIHVVWHGKDSTEPSQDNIRYSKSTDGGATWSAVTKLTAGNTSANSQQMPAISVDNANRLYVIWFGVDPSVSTFANIRRKDFDGVAWSAISNVTTSTTSNMRYPNAMDKEKNSMIGFIYQDVNGSAVKFDSITLNQAPTLTLTNPSDNLSLTEGATYTLAGTASDVDSGNAVTVKYAINGGTARNITSAVSDGASPIPYSKVLTFQNGRLWDGVTDVSGPLAENTTYSVSVYATDDAGGTSTSFTRSFKVILNRPPTITLDAYNANRTGMSELETLTFTGTVTDPESDNVNLTVTFNGGAPVTLKSGVPSGTTFEYTVPVSALVNGSNTVVFTATDTKGAAKTKTLTFAKSGTQTPVKTAVVRYAITPPLGTTAEVVAWVNREAGDLNVAAAHSIVTSGANESFATMTKNASVPVGDGTIYEDEFVGTVGTAAAKVTLRLTLTRANASSAEAVKKIMGGIG